MVRSALGNPRNWQQANANHAVRLRAAQAAASRADKRKRSEPKDKWVMAEATETIVTETPTQAEKPRMFNPPTPQVKTEDPAEAKVEAEIETDELTPEQIEAEVEAKLATDGTANKVEQRLQRRQAELERTLEEQAKRLEKLDTLDALNEKIEALSKSLTAAPANNPTPQQVDDAENASDELASLVEKFQIDDPTYAPSWDQLKPLLTTLATRIQKGGKQVQPDVSALVSQVKDALKGDLQAITEAKKVTDQFQRQQQAEKSNREFRAGFPEYVPEIPEDKREDAIKEYLRVYNDKIGQVEAVFDKLVARGVATQEDHDELKQAKIDAAERARLYVVTKFKPKAATAKKPNAKTDSSTAGTSIQQPGARSGGVTTTTKPKPRMYLGT